MTDRRRDLPSVSALLESREVQVLMTHTPRSIVVEAVRQVIDRARRDRGFTPASDEDWHHEIAANVAVAERVSLRRVINATGVVLHTNLGRAPLATEALDAVARVAQGYSNLEYDASTGHRGSRYSHCASLLRELTGAEDALVVNNGAAALVLALNTVCDGRECLLSRGEFVEIGGSFRVHDIIAKSGARIREVGATNRTHVSDYADALSADTGAIVKVHRSNFAIEGYVADTPVSALLATARGSDIPIIHDLGSGLMIPLARIGLTGEPTATDALAAGASIVVMSGDKLLGGPQAGIILGEARHVGAMRSNPLARAYRVDKMTLAALEATLMLYRTPDTAFSRIPTLALLGASIEQLRVRADRVSACLRSAGVPHAIVPSESTVGAGAFPTTVLPSVAIALDGSAEQWSRALRAQEPAVVGRVNGGAMRLDLRAVPHADVESLAAAVVAAQ